MSTMRRMRTPIYDQEHHEDGSISLVMPDGSVLGHSAVRENAVRVDRFGTTEMWCDDGHVRSWDRTGLLVGTSDMEEVRRQPGHTERVGRILGELRERVALKHAAEAAGERAEMTAGSNHG